MAINEKSEFQSGSEFLTMWFYSVDDINFAPKSVIKKADKRKIGRAHV